mgnify:CR=1 FL=1
MRKKALLIVLVLVLVMAAPLTAASKGSIGLVNYGTLAMFEDAENSDFYTGLRGEFFFSDFLGVSADAMVLFSAEDEYLMLYMVDAVGRIPLGFLEPYVALGFNFLGVLSEEEDPEPVEFGVNVRGGVDFNIFDWLSFGIEANFILPDFATFFDNIDAYFTEEALQNSLIGVTAKFKF